MDGIERMCSHDSKPGRKEGGGVGTGMEKLGDELNDLRRTGKK